MSSDPEIELAPPLKPTEKINQALAAFQSWKTEQGARSAAAEIVPKSEQAKFGEELEKEGKDIINLASNNKFDTIKTFLEPDDTDTEETKLTRIHRARELVKSDSITQTPEATARILEVSKIHPDVLTDTELVNRMESQLYELGSTIFPTPMNERLSKVIRTQDEKQPVNAHNKNLMEALAKANPDGKSAVYLGLLDGAEAVNTQAKKNQETGRETNLDYSLFAEQDGQVDGHPLDLVAMSSVMVDIYPGYNLLVGLPEKLKNEKLTTRAKATVLGAATATAYRTLAGRAPDSIKAKVGEKLANCVSALFPGEGTYNLAQSRTRDSKPDSLMAETFWLTVNKGNEGSFAKSMHQKDLEVRDEQSRKEQALQAKKEKEEQQKREAEEQERQRIANELVAEATKAEQARVTAQVPKETTKTQEQPGRFQKIRNLFKRS